MVVTTLISYEKQIVINSRLQKAKYSSIFMWRHFLFIYVYTINCHLGNNERSSVLTLNTGTLKTDDGKELTLVDSADKIRVTKMLI